MRSRRQNAPIVPRIATSNMTISTSATPICWRPKNKYDQPKFNSRYSTNNTIAHGSPRRPSRRRTRHAATAIMTKSAVHTGANIQLGGLNAGFCRVVYQVPTLVAVTTAPAIDTAKHSARKPIRPAISRTRLLPGMKSVTRPPRSCSPASRRPMRTTKACRPYG